MPRPRSRRTWSVVIAITVVVFGAEAALFAAGCARAPSLPDARITPLAADTTLTLPGLTAPARIVTDRHGIVHVHTENLTDLYRVWGFVTARDRLWQMLHTRQSARGDLWRWFGNRALRGDGGAQLFEMAERVERIWARESADSAQRMALEAYADGVNAWMDLCREGRVSWPIELQRLDKVPDPWRPQDSYLVLFGMAFVLDFDVPELRERTELTQKGEDAFRARRRFENDFIYATIPDEAARRQWGDHPANAPVALMPAQDPETRASNEFAIGAARSASGRPILANDPHLPLGTPGPLYAIHVSCAEGAAEAAGASLPGIPAIVSGRNHTCAWGLTALSADVVDVYADTLSADMKRTKTEDGWQTLREDGFTMRYQAGPLELPTIGQKRRYTHHGPVVAIDKERRIAWSVKWASDDSRLTLSRLIGLERSVDANEVAARVRSVLTPCFNIVTADVGGHVRYQTIGAVPRRGFVPGPGPLPGDGRHEWLGLIAPDSMPAWDVPPGEVIVNGNNLPARSFPEPLPRYDWDQERALRMAERLQADRSITAADARSVQNDVVSLTARRMVPVFLSHLAASSGPLTTRERAVVDSLQGWDFACRRSRVAPTLFRAWYNAFLRRSNLDYLHGLAAAALDGRAPEALVDPLTQQRETPSRAVRAALDSALVHLETMLGPDMHSWTWGRAHRARFVHPLAWLDPELTPETVAMDGDNVTPSVGRSNLPWDWRVTHGPVWRHVVDLADPDLSWCVVAPGNPSEGPLRTGLADDWARHGYVPLEMRWDRIDRAKISDVRLTPGTAAAN